MVYRTQIAKSATKWTPTIPEVTAPLARNARLTAMVKIDPISAIAFNMTPKVFLKVSRKGSCFVELPQQKQATSEATLKGEKMDKLDIGTSTFFLRK